MATSTARAKCFSCNKEARRYNCEGCSRDFCFSCLTKHRQILGQEIDRIENDHDQFRDKLNQQKADSTKHVLIQTINQWGKDSITKVKQTAEECRGKLMNYTTKHLMELENKLNSIAKEIQLIREENEFNEIDLKQFKGKLNKLKEELHKPSNVTVGEQASFINKIVVTVLTNQGNTRRWSDRFSF